ncbi:MAG: hypothetical protein IJS30_02925 [Bacteroidales bacterium]|nr:hypothetical protein [Bacteroidales bacterium]
MKKTFSLLICLLLLFSVPSVAQVLHFDTSEEEEQEKEPAKISSFYYPLNFAFLTNDVAKGIEVSFGMLSYDRYFGETSSYIKQNATRVITLNFPQAYYLDKKNTFFLYPKIGFGYGWTVVEIKGYDPESEGAFVFNLHPQAGIRLGPVGITAGYLYHAYKFKFNGKGVFTLGLAIGLDNKR